MSSPSENGYGNPPDSPGTGTYHHAITTVDGWPTSDVVGRSGVRSG